MEEWRDVVGYEGVYQVSNMGRMQSVNRIVKHWRGGLQRLKTKVLCPTIGKRGYCRIGLFKNGQCKRKLVHRLVLEAYIGFCPLGMECRHLDDNPSNNHLSNLQWGTPKDNGTDRREHGKHIISIGRPVKRSDGKTYPSLQQAADSVQRSRKVIWNACNGLQATAGGFQWEYV